MPNLASQRCFNHAAREAAARCPECGRCFCRECVSEHEDRLICAACLKQLTRPQLSKRYHFVGLFRLVQLVLGILVLWSSFYLLGQALLSIPTTFHDAKIWEAFDASGDKLGSKHASGPDKLVEEPGE